MARPSTDLDVDPVVSFTINIGISIAEIRKYHIPYIGAFLTAVGAIKEINSYSNRAELARYEEAMNQGTGVLIITWDVAGSRCVPASYNAYYSWNGKDDLFEEGDDLL